MRVLSLLLVSVSTFFVPDPVTNGVKIVTRQVTGPFSDIKTEYFTANALRGEWQIRMKDRTGPPMASIIQRSGSNHRVFVLDLQAHEYMTSQGAAFGVRPSPLPSSGGVLQIWIDYTDTGERLIMWGHMARHILTRERRIASPGACSGSSETETDGWYIDDSAMPAWHRDKKPGMAFVATVKEGGAPSACFEKVMDTIQVHRNGVDPGFPLKTSTIVKTPVLSLNGETKMMVASNSGSEVIDFQEGPLDPKLFDVPADFRKVDELKSWLAPAPRRQLSPWEWIGQKLAQIFD